MSELRVTKCIMLETGAYNPMFTRPYASNVTRDSHMAFQAATMDGSSVSATNLAGIAGNIIKPTAAPGVQIDIPNGWGERRLLFMMEVEQHNPHFGVSATQVITGYTDHRGLSMSNHIDPNMMMHFNNTIIIRTNNRPTAHGNVATRVVNNASHVIRCPTLANQQPPTFGQFGVSNNTLHTLMPEDVMGRLSLGGMEFLGGVTDLRATIPNSHIRKSSRTNGLAADYLSRSINGIAMAISQPDVNVDETSELYGAARDRVREALVPKDPFIQYITLHSMFQQDMCVSYRDMCRMFPDLDRVNTVVVSGQAQKRNQGPSHYNTEGFSGTTMETQIVTALMYSIPALMFGEMFTELTIAASNETHDGQFNVDLYSPQSFAGGVDMSPYLHRFADRLRMEVLADISNNSMIQLSLKMHFNCLGESHISLSFLGQPPVDYVIPSFCDALMAPVLSYNDLSLPQMAADIQTLASNVQTF